MPTQRCELSVRVQLPHIIFLTFTLNSSAKYSILTSSLSCLSSFDYEQFLNKEQLKCLKINHILSMRLSY